MKKQLSLVKQLAAVAVTGSMVCFVSNANGQAAGPEPTIEPTRVGSMSGVGQKPRKSDKEKQADADAAKAGTTTTSQTAGGSTTKGGEKAQPGSNEMSDMDRTFMMQAAKDGMKEVHMGQMAAQQGQSDTVKKLGRTIAADHQKANQQLMAIAAKKGVKPDTRTTEHGMSKRDMKNFDQAWIGMMVNDHQKDIALYQRQAQQGADPDLKAYAKKTLPVLQKHLKMVQQAQKQMGSGGTNPAGMAPSAGATKSGR
jgi:putative membrane protein